MLNVDIRYYDVILSTNSEAVNLARLGATTGTVICAKQQNEGHGRMQRIWNSPAGGLWFSIILRPKIDPSSVSQLTLLAGVAVARALRKMYETDDIYIKWPNDILLNQKKIAGILSEAYFNENGYIDYTVVGIGVNVNLKEKDFVKEIRDTATSLNLGTGKTYACKKVLQAILTEFFKLYEGWELNGAHEMISAWQFLNCTLGHPVVVKDNDREIFYGIAESMNSDGSLRVKNSEGVIQNFNFGEISIRSGMGR